MLEEKLESLETQVVKLTDAVIALTKSVSKSPPAEAPKGEKNPGSGKAPEAGEESPNIPESNNDSPVTRDELQDLCLQIVRADRTMKDTIKQVISKFGDAKTLKDVPEKDLAALHQVLALTLENLEGNK